MTEKSASDVLRELLDERSVEYEAYRDIKNRRITKWRTYHGAFVFFAIEKEGKLFVETASDTEHSAICTPEQAIAATLGKPKAKAHPYGYEPDTGAFDCTRCECGCINDISAAYCNDCGGEIEIDMYAEKEIYRTPRHLVFAAKHDDGSLEFCERRYVPEDSATLGVDVKDCENLLWEFIGALDVADATDADKKPIVSDYARRIAATLGSEREKALEELVRDMNAALIHDNCYRWCEAKEPCNLITDGKCQYRERIRELGIEVVTDER